LLAEAGIDYVLVPQIIARPASLETMFRWRPPLTEPELMPADVGAAPYLRLVFDADGASVYQLDETLVMSREP
ncbi:MAG: hypothetical protein CUN53_20840, partial [Phototrophicales bacterium]